MYFRAHRTTLTVRNQDDGLIWLFGKDESPFIDNINDAYDHFNERLRTAEHDFIEIGIEMDWQKLVNKAAEVETKAKVRGSRTSAYKASVCPHAPPDAPILVVHPTSKSSMPRSPVRTPSPRPSSRPAPLSPKLKQRPGAIYGHLTREFWKSGACDPPPHI